MNGLVTFVVAATMFVLAGCGDGTADTPAASVSHDVASVPTIPSLPAALFDNTNAPKTTGLPVAHQAAVIDPPTSPIAMSAGVTETIDPPIGLKCKRLLQQIVTCPP
jgi:hypothetical protein